MSKVFMNKRKTATAVIAVALCAVMIFGGTFAWQSISQTALNEVASVVNPGGRLHDDFVDITFGADEIADYDTMTFDKNVYVENFTSLADNGVQVFARIRLDEYMELGKGAGGLTDDGKAPSATNQASSIVPGAKLENKATWSTHIPGKNDPFHTYWDWTIGGKTSYMPTFNKDKTSLEADINGSFAEDFKDYVDYSNVTDTNTDDWTDTNADGELAKTDNAVYAVEDADGKVTQKTIEETHVVKETIDGYVITMEEWLALPDNAKTGDFWVWDADGWAYWANPINPSTATGLLLNGINRTNEIINEDWYYGINVVAQFITKDDIGYVNGSGFYDTKDGSVPPSAEALLLLDEIGVEVTYEVSTEEDLEKALARGGNIVLTKDITLTKPLTVSANTTLDLGEHTITTAAPIYDNDVNDVWSLISAQGENTTLTINGGNFKALENDCFAVDVRDGAKVVINGGTFVGNISAVYVHKGSALINGGTFSIQQLADDAADKYNQMINAYNANREAGDATITISGGKFVGFNPSLADDGNLVAENYKVTESDGDNGVKVYTVSKVDASTGEATE